MRNKKWIALAAAVVLAVTALPLGVFAAKKDETKLAKVTLNEVAHSIFYAPQYVAIDSAVNFAQFTQRAGNFLVAREEMPDVKWEDLKDKKVLGGRKGGVHISM